MTMTLEWWFKGPPTPTLTRWTLVTFQNLGVNITILFTIENRKKCIIKICMYMYILLSMKTYHLVSVYFFSFFFKTFIWTELCFTLCFRSDVSIVTCRQAGKRDSTKPLSTLLTGLLFSVMPTLHSYGTSILESP